MKVFVTLILVFTYAVKNTNAGIYSSDYMLRGSHIQNFSRRAFYMFNNTMVLFPMTAFDSKHFDIGDFMQ